MKLETIHQEILPTGRVKLHAEVIYDTFLNSTNKDNFYFEYPSFLSNDISDNGNPWIALFLPISAVLSENLIITKPVNAQLLEGCREILKIWNYWDPSLSVINIEADVEADTNREVKKKTGTFFSGGVDSLHTLLKHEDTPNAPCAESIDDLISIIDIYEFDSDTTSANNVAQDNMRMRIQKISEKYNKNVVDINTNIWLTRFNLTDSSIHSMTSFLSSTALSLSNRYSRVLIPSSGTYGQGLRGTNHPLIDRLHSTTHTKFIPDSYNYNRFEKVAYLSNCNHNLSNLHVCSRDGALENCSECYKCIHSMLELEVLGELIDCKLFKQSQWDLNKASRLYCSTSDLLIELESIRKNAAVKNRSDIVHTVDVIFCRSAWIDACRRLIHKICTCGLLNSHDIDLLNELVGVSESGILSEETRLSLDIFFENHRHLRCFLTGLENNVGLDKSDISVSDFGCLERALLSGSHNEPVLERLIGRVDLKLAAPEVIYVDGKPHACI